MIRWKITIKETKVVYFKEVCKDGRTYTYTKGMDDFFKPKPSPWPLESHRFLILDFSK